MTIDTAVIRDKATDPSPSVALVGSATVVALCDALDEARAAEEGALAIIAQERGEVLKLRDQLAEMTRRRDAWAEKAKGIDEMRAAVRKGIEDAGDRNLSRVFLRGALVESERSLAEARAENERLREALRPFVHYVHDDYRQGDGRYALASVAVIGQKGGGWLEAEDFRRARAALGQEGDA